jgi:hypothetical protein
MNLPQLALSQTQVAPTSWAALQLVCKDADNVACLHNTGSHCMCRPVSPAWMSRP